MASLDRYLEKWRGYFGSSGSNIFEVMEAAFAVASSDCPGELLHHKKSIAKLLQVGCSRPEEMELLVFTNINNRYRQRKLDGKPNNDASSKPAAPTDQEPAPAAQEKMEMNEPAAALHKKSIKIKARLGSKTNRLPSKLAPKEPSHDAVPLIKPCKPSGAAPSTKPCKPSDAVPLLKPCKPSNDGTKLENAKRKLREGYQQAEKRKRIQVLSSHHLPKLVTDHEVPAAVSNPPAPAAAVPIKPSKPPSMRAKLETARRKLYAQGVKKRRQQNYQQPKRNCARPRAEAEAKRTRESEREAARQALLKVVKTVEFNDNSQSLKDLEIMLGSIPAGVGGFRLGGTNPLEQLGLYLK